MKVCSRDLSLISFFSIDRLQISMVDHNILTKSLSKYSDVWTLRRE